MKTTVYFLKEGEVYEVDRYAIVVPYGPANQDGIRSTRTIYEDRDERPCENEEVLQMFRNGDRDCRKRRHS